MKKKVTKELLSEIHKLFFHPLHDPFISFSVGILSVSDIIPSAGGSPSLSPWVGCCPVWVSWPNPHLWSINPSVLPLKFVFA